MPGGFTSSAWTFRCTRPAIYTFATFRPASVRPKEDSPFRNSHPCSMATFRAASVVSSSVRSRPAASVDHQIMHDAARQRFRVGRHVRVRVKFCDCLLIHHQIGQLDAVVGCAGRILSFSELSNVVQRAAFLRPTVIQSIGSGCGLLESSFRTKSLDICAYVKDEARREAEKMPPTASRPRRRVGSPRATTPCQRPDVGDKIARLDKHRCRHAAD
jgi:hypothetical protein